MEMMSKGDLKYMNPTNDTTDPKKNNSPCIIYHSLALKMKSNLVFYSMLLRGPHNTQKRAPSDISLSMYRTRKLINGIIHSSIDNTVDE